jgi:hypothetical protein
MITPIVIETRRNGNPVGNPRPTGPSSPVTAAAW